MADGLTFSVDFGALSFDDTGSSYRLINAGLTDLAVRRSLVFSPDIDGAAETSNALDEGVYELQVRVVGSSWSDCEDLTDALFNAARQRAYSLAVTLGGRTRTWQARGFSRWSAPLHESY